MSNIPLVTIITPCYNGEKFIEKYFKAILEQSYQNIELIFVDDGSTDNTASIAKSYAESFFNRGIKYKYIYQENGGQAKAMNTGFREMTGDYLIWPDSDDILNADSIEKRVHFLEENTEFDMVRSNGDYFDYQTGEKLYRISNFDNRFKEDIFLDLILETTYCSCGCYMIRISAFKKIYPHLIIHESDAGQNWQILIPMAGRYRCGYIDEDQYHIAVRRDSHSRRKRTIDEQVKRYLELKDILLKGIALSERQDRCYEAIVEEKYNRILMEYYLSMGKKDFAKKFYLKMKNENVLSKDDKLIYFQKINYFIYAFYKGLELYKRGLNKLKREIMNVFEGSR